MLAYPSSSLLFLGLLVRAAAWRAEADLRSEARSETGTGGDPGAALQLDPRGEVDATLHQGSATLSYAPQLLLGVGAEGVGFLQRADLIGRFHSESRWELRINAGGSYGFSDLSPITQSQGGGAPVTVVPTTTAPLQTLEPLPSTTSLRLLELRAEVGASHPLTRRWQLDVRAGAAVRGGADYASREELPLEQISQGEGSLTYQWDRTQTLRGRLAEEYDTLSPDAGAPPTAIGPRASVTELTAEWANTVDRRSTLTLEGGAAWVWSELQQGEGTAQPLPILGASYEARSVALEEGRPKALVLHVRLAPYFDRLTGLVYPQVEGRASVGSVVTGAVSIEAVAGVAGPATHPLDVRSLLLAEVHATDRLSSGSRLSAGIRGLAGTTGAQVLLFLAFQIEARTGPAPGGSP